MLRRMKQVLLLSCLFVPLMGCASEFGAKKPKPETVFQTQIVKVDRPIPVELFADHGVQDLILPPKPTDTEIALAITDLGEALANYRCQLNYAGHTLAALPVLPECADRGLLDKKPG